MSIIGQQIAYARYLENHKELIEFINQSEELEGFHNLPYNETFSLELTQEDIDNPKNPFMSPNHPTYLLILKNPEPSPKLKQKVRELEKTMFPNSNAKFFFLRPHIKIGRDIAHSIGYNKK